MLAVRGRDALANPLAHHQSLFPIDPIDELVIDRPALALEHLVKHPIPSARPFTDLPPFGLSGLAGVAGTGFGHALSPAWYATRFGAVIRRMSPFRSMMYAYDAVLSSVVFRYSIELCAESPSVVCMTSMLTLAPVRSGP